MTAVDFYSKLFSAEPAKRRPGYANFAIAEPPLKLVLIEDPDARGNGVAGALNHLGVEVETPSEVSAATRPAAGEVSTPWPRGHDCCYAVQDKVWVNDPDGAPWEVYTVLADAPERTSDRRAPAAAPRSTAPASPPTAVADVEFTTHGVPRRRSEWLRLLSVSDLVTETPRPAEPDAPVLQRLSTLDRFLPVWIGAAMALGLVLGRGVPGPQRHPGPVKIGSVSLPIALGLLLMMYPVLAKVRYGELGRVTGDRRLLVILAGAELARRPGAHVRPGLAAAARPARPTAPGSSSSAWRAASPWC